MKSSKKSQKKSVWIIATAVVVFLVILTILIVGPLYSANAWRSHTREDVNKTVKVINDTGTNIQSAMMKLEFDEDSMLKAHFELKKQIAELEKAKSNLKEVGGISAIDVTGSYREAQDIHDEIDKAYTDLLAMDKQSLKDSEMGYELYKATYPIQDVVNPESLEEAKQLVEKIRTVSNDMSKIVKDMPKEYAGTQWVKVYSQMATLLEKMIADAEAGNVSAVEAAQKELAELEKKGDALQKELLALNSKQVKDLATTIKRLNDATERL